MMSIESILVDTAFIKDVGFPIASFAVIVSILMFVMKSHDKKQEKTESRYEKLVDKFIGTTKELSDKQENSMKEIAEELKKFTVELKDTNAKLDSYKEIIERDLEARSLSYIFKQTKKD
jgi:septal ring factor EnvC (AmiA/AmiB activator)